MINYRVHVLSSDSVVLQPTHLSNKDASTYRVDYLAPAVQTAFMHVANAWLQTLPHVNVNPLTQLHGANEFSGTS